MKSFFREPVFVDPTGRRSRTFRRVGVVVSAPTSAYLVLMVSSVLGGPTIDTPLLPPAAADRAQADSAAQEPARGDDRVEPAVPVPSTVLMTIEPTEALPIGVDPVMRPTDRAAAQRPAVPSAGKPAAKQAASVEVPVAKPTQQPAKPVSKPPSKPSTQVVEKPAAEPPAAKPAATKPAATEPATKPSAPKPPRTQATAPGPLAPVVKPVLKPVVVVVTPIVESVIDPVVELVGGVGGLLGLGK